MHSSCGNCEIELRENYLWALETDRSKQLERRPVGARTKREWLAAGLFYSGGEGVMQSMTTQNTAPFLLQLEHRTSNLTYN